MPATEMPKVYLIVGDKGNERPVDCWYVFYHNHKDVKKEVFSSGDAKLNEQKAREFYESLKLNLIKDATEELKGEKDKDDNPLTKVLPVVKAKVLYHYEKGEDG
tara:strand:+ start:442 stop:753 length:312 start_codon:yes stop_codon:yes gene_type:complete